MFQEADIVTLTTIGAEQVSGPVYCTCNRLGRSSTTVRQIITQPHIWIHRDASLLKARGHVGDRFVTRNVSYKFRLTIQHLETIQKVSDVVSFPVKCCPIA